MADTPSALLPIDPREQPVLDQLLAIRTSLELLKQDRTTYIKSSDVIPLYDKVIEQVKILNGLRADHPCEENRGRSSYPPQAVRHNSDRVGSSGSRSGGVFPIDIAIFHDYR